MESQTSEVVTFSSWQLKEKPLVDGGILNEVTYTELLNNFLKLLQWYCAHRATTGEGASTQYVTSQILCYTDRLMEVFNNPSTCIRLQATRLLLSKAMPVVKLVMKLSPDALDGDRMHTDSEYMYQLIIRGMQRDKMSTRRDGGKKCFVPIYRLYFKFACSFVNFIKLAPSSTLKLSHLSRFLVWKTCISA